MSNPDFEPVYGLPSTEELAQLTATPKPSSFSLKPEAPPSTKPPLVTIPLKELDLPTELAEQFALAKQVFNEIRYDTETPANQKAQLLNTISSILTSIVKMQEAAYSVERLKLLEDTLIKVLQNHETLRDAFIVEYGAALAKLGKSNG